MSGKVRFVDSNITISPGAGGTSHAAISASYALSASYADYAVSASHEIVKEVSSSYADTASYAITASYALNGGGGGSGIFTETGSFYATTNNLQVTGSLKTSKPIDTSGYVLVKHNGALVSGGTAALFLGTTHQGMDLVRLNDNTLVLGGVTQNYGWRIFGIKHGLQGSTYTTEIDNLIATGSINVSGSIDISLQSGSAFTITEDDVDQENRLTFEYENGDPTLIIAGRSAESSLHLKYNLAGEGLKLTNQGLITRQVSGVEYGLRLSTNSFQPETGNQLDLGYYNDRWKTLYLYTGNKISWGTTIDDDLASIRHTSGTNKLTLSGSSDVLLDVQGQVSASTNLFAKQLYVEDQLAVDYSNGIAIGNVTDPIRLINDVNITGSLTVSGPSYFESGSITLDRTTVPTLPGNSDKVNIGTGGSGAPYKAFQIYTNGGYVIIGPQNDTYSHFTTDRSKFYFNKPLQVEGEVMSHTGENLVLGNDGGTSDTITIAQNDIIFELNNQNIFHMTTGSAGGILSGSASSTASFGTYLGDGSQLSNLPANTFQQVLNAGNIAEDDPAAPNTPVGRFTLTDNNNYIEYSPTGLDSTSGLGNIELTSSAGTKIILNAPTIEIPNGDAIISGSLRVTGSFLNFHSIDGDGFEVLTEASGQILQAITLTNDDFQIGASHRNLKLYSTNQTASLEGKVVSIKSTGGENINIGHNTLPFPFPIVNTNIGNGDRSRLNVDVESSNITGSLNITGSAIISGSLSISGSLLNTGTVSVNNGNGSPASPYTLTGTQQFVLIDPSGGDVTINMPDAATYPGRQIFFKLTQAAGANTVTLQRQGADTIDGATTYTDLDIQYESISTVSNGSDGWFIF